MSTTADQRLLATGKQRRQRKTLAVTRRHSKPQTGITTDEFRGLVAQKLGQSAADAASHLLESRLDKDSDTPQRSLYLAGALLSELKLWEEASLLIERAVEIERGNPAYVEELLVALIRSRQWDKACETAALCIGQDANSYEMHRVILKLCGSRLEWWCTRAAAMTFAEYIHNGYLLFPELAGIVSRSSLALALVRFCTRHVQYSFKLHITILLMAYLIDSRTQYIKMHLAVALAGAGFFDEAAQLTADGAIDPESYNTLLRIAREHQRCGNETRAAKLLSPILAHCTELSDIAQEVLGSVTYGHNGNLASLQNLAQSVLRDVKLVHDACRTAPAISPPKASSRERGDYLSLLLSTRKLIGSSRNNAAHELALAPTASTSGPTSYANFLLEYSGFNARIPASLMKSTYAQHDPRTGYLSAADHPEHGVFAFGPYVDLKAGAYAFEIWALWDRTGVLDVSVSRYQDNTRTDYGYAQFLAAGASEVPAKLGRLETTLVTSGVNIEILIRVRTPNLILKLAWIEIHRQSAPAMLSGFAFESTAETTDGLAPG